jgi:hypothetical protein
MARKRERLGPGDLKMFDSAFHTQDSIQGEPSVDMQRARAVESFADDLLATCATFAGAEAIVSDHDLNETMLLESMVAAVARWNGRSATAGVAMRHLHIMLSNALQNIAEREIK